MILWADTFNNYFQPEVAKAAVEVLEDAGFQVEVPAQDLCCGRPLYDYGMLDRAQRYLRRVIDVLRPELEQGTPVVALEPSCLSVLQDEAPVDEGTRYSGWTMGDLPEIMEIERGSRTLMGVS